MYVKRERLDAVARFWAKVDIKTKTECWQWKGCLTKGYGTYNSGNGKNLRANRAAWFFTFGEIPKGLHVLHKCDNSKCCNPNHLFLGTHADNVADMISKKRNAFGDTAGQSKLNSSQASEIKKLKPAYPHKTGNGSLVESLARKFNVKRSAIYYIWRCETWKHV